MLCEQSIDEKANVTPCLHRMRVAQQNTIEVIITSDAVYTGCCAARQISNRKLLPCSIYDVLTQIYKLQFCSTAPHWSNHIIAGSYIRSYEIKRLLDNKNNYTFFFIVDVVDNVD